MKRLKVIGYARVSTDEQANSGLSLDSQRAKIEGYCDLYDLELVAVIVDAGQSGKTLNRKGLQRSLKMLGDGKAEGIVIVKLDRLTRSIADWQTLIDGYFGDKAGQQLFSVGCRQHRHANGSGASCVERPAVRRAMGTRSDRRAYPRCTATQDS